MTYKWRLQTEYLDARDGLAGEPVRRWIGQVAIHGDRVVALAECGGAPGDPQSPTLTVNIADAWLTSGIARRTLRELISRCLGIGLTAFRLDYFASNIGLDFLADTVAAELGVPYSLIGVTRSGLGQLSIRGWSARPRPEGMPARQRLGAGHVRRGA
ncbi:hypothetical protein [Actinoplanes sp. NPDC048796]|uniref:hypothetical protein n=1 Tax=Actinoplanes sp. NPDC048796 TaxID=3155640 RepID=UPI00340DF93D